MATKIKPLHDKVLVERLQSLEKTAGGIVLPDTAKEKPTEGRVLAVGSGKRNDKGERIAPGVKVGDKVLFGSFAGTTIREAGKELLILDEHDLLGVVDDAPWTSQRGSGERTSGGSKAAGKSKK
jgi:chaperonin GroES